MGEKQNGFPMLKVCIQDLEHLFRVGLMKHSPGEFTGSLGQISLLSQKTVGHQLQQCKRYRILAVNLFLLSKIFPCLASLCAYRLYKLGPRC